MFVFFFYDRSVGDGFIYLDLSLFQKEPHPECNLSSQPLCLDSRTQVYRSVEEDYIFNEVLFYYNFYDMNVILVFDFDVIVFINDFDFKVVNYLQDGSWGFVSSILRLLTFLTKRLSKNIINITTKFLT